MMMEMKGVAESPRGAEGDREQEFKPFLVEVGAGHTSVGRHVAEG